MYQVVINNKYYVSDVDFISTMIGTISYIWGVDLTKDMKKGKFFDMKIDADMVAEETGGRVIEYVEKKDDQIEIKCDVDLEKVYKEKEKWKKFRR